MTTYSLNAGLFVFDRDLRAVGDPVEALEAVASAGFQETELMAEGDEWQTPGGHDPAKLRAAVDHLGIFPHTIHAPFQNVNLASPDPELRRAGVAVVADAIRFLGELGGRTAVVHPSARPGPGEPAYVLDNLGAAMENAHRSVGELVRVAEETGVRIALENLARGGMDCRPLETTQELRALIADFPPERVGICLDVGHCLITGADPAAQARIAAERLFALHLQDGDGQEDRHWVPGKGMIDWREMEAALTDIGFDGAWTIEVVTAHTDDPIETIVMDCVALRKRWESSGISAVH